MTELILIMNCKSCQLDPIPTVLLKKALPEVIDDLVRIVNVQLETGEVPRRYKTAIVRPLLKKQGLDPEIFNNYRPVSNLSFEHKFTERIN